MSILVDTIYPAIAALSVNVGSATPRVDSLSAIKNAYETADLPARILTPFSERAGGEVTGFYTAKGRLHTVDWLITDLLLYEAVGQERGMGRAAAHLARYVIDYFEAAKTLRGVAWTLTGLRAQHTIIEWPIAAERWYRGVVIELTVQEIW